MDVQLTVPSQIQANDKKRSRDERELVHRYKPFAKLQTALDYEVMIEGLLCEPTDSVLSSEADRS